MLAIIFSPFFQNSRKWAFPVPIKITFSIIFLLRNSRKWALPPPNCKPIFEFLSSKLTKTIFTSAQSRKQALRTHPTLVESLLRPTTCIVPSWHLASTERLPGVIEAEASFILFKWGKVWKKFNLCCWAGQDLKFPWLAYCSFFCRAQSSCNYHCGRGGQASK